MKHAAPPSPARPPFRAHTFPRKDWTHPKNVNAPLPQLPRAHRAKIQAVPGGRHCHCHCSEFGVEESFAFHDPREYESTRKKPPVVVPNNGRVGTASAQNGKSAPKVAVARIEEAKTKSEPAARRTSVRFASDPETSKDEFYRELREHQQQQSITTSANSEAAGGDDSFVVVPSSELPFPDRGSNSSEGAPSMVFPSQHERSEVDRRPSSVAASSSVSQVTSRLTSNLDHHRMAGVMFQHKLLEIRKLIGKMRREQCQCGPTKEKTSKIRVHDRFETSTFAKEVQRTGTSSVSNKVEAGKTTTRKKAFHRDEAYSEFHRVPLYIARPNVFKEYRKGQERREFQRSIDKAFNRIG